MDGRLFSIREQSFWTVEQIIGFTEVEGALYGTEQDIRIDQNAQLAAIRTQAGTADSLIGDGRGSILKLVSGESTPLFVSGTCNFGIFLSNYVKVEDRAD